MFSCLDASIVSTALVSISIELQNYHDVPWVVLAYLLTYMSRWFCSFRFNLSSFFSFSICYFLVLLSSFSFRSSSFSFSLYPLLSFSLSFLLVCFLWLGTG